MIFDKLDVFIKFLEFGILGFSAIALIFCAFIVYIEQRRSGSPRKGIITLATYFGIFCIVLISINMYLQTKNIPNDPKILSELYLSEEKNLREIDPNLLSVTLNPTTPNKVWAQAYRYRATVRSLLRKNSINNNISIEDHESIMKMADQLTTIGIIDLELKNKIDNLAWATFTIQWGAGTPPTREEIEFVFAEAPEIIIKLRDIAVNNS